MRVRATALLAASGLVALMVVARGLVPSTAGLGTHQQLGLPPCSIRWMLGIRCPACGMTTSWAHFARGEWAESLHVNVGGFLLALLSLAAIGLALRVSWTGRPPAAAAQQVLLIVLIGIGTVTLADWARRVIG